ncbi:Centrosomal protein of 83 kDa [Nowakowskiella sp. JEL0407]|nr:Centrosomal protein of 83 kDa [Nowakowskiella sp. JEL0407]
MNDLSEFSVVEKLRFALRLVETLKQENEVYKENFDQLKESYEKLKLSLEDSNKKNYIISKEKSVIEEQIDESVKYWKDQYETKCREVDDLKSREVLPKDLGIMRFKIAQDIEIASEKRFKVLKSETEKYRDLYHKLFRESELFRIDADNQKSEFKKVVNEIKHAHSEELVLMEQKIVSLQQSIANVSDAEKTRDIQRENSNLQCQVQSLLNELEEVRAQKETLTVTFESQERLHKKKLFEESAFSKVVSSERDALKSKVSVLQNEINMNLKQIDTLTEENTRIQREFERSKSSMDALLHQTTIESNDLKAAHLKEKSQFESSIAELRRKIQELKSSQKSLEDTAQELRGKLSTKEKEYLEKLQLVREEEWGKLSKLETEKSDLERQVQILMQKLREIESRQESNNKEQSQEISSLKRTNADLLTKTTELQNKIDRLEIEKLQSTTESQNLSNKLQEHDSKNEQYFRDISMYQRQENAMRERLNKLESQLQVTQNELVQTHDILDKERESFSHSSERQQSNLMKERQGLLKKIEILSKSNSEMKDQIFELRNAIEHQQTIFKEKWNSIKTRVKDIKIQNASLKEKSEKEANDISNQWKEFQKRQNDFMKFLSNEGIVLS